MSNNKQIAHLWANRSRPSGKGSHFYFEGDTIYSYGAHFPIARHHKGVVLFTGKGYSVSTAKHITITRQAVNHLATFTVRDVLANPSGADVKLYAERIADSALSISRKRGNSVTFWLGQHEHLVNEANAFCAKFGFKTRFALPSAEELEAIRAKAQIQSAKKAKQTAEKNKRIAKEQADAIAKWLAGERVSIPYGVQKVYLRAILRDAEKFAGVGHPDTLQTSRGAEVQLSQAKLAFRFIIAKRDTGWHRNGETFAIGDFQLDAVNEQGIVAGCHRIGWDEIERFAKAQGWV